MKRADVIISWPSTGSSIFLIRSHRSGKVLGQVVREKLGPRLGTRWHGGGRPWLTKDEAIDAELKAIASRQGG